MQEGPFKSVAEAATENVIKQVFVTYYVNENGDTAVKTAERRFFKDDYVDSTQSDILSLTQN
jgi:hypothetical protein